MKTGMSPEYWQKVIEATQAPWDQSAKNRINELEWDQYFKFQDLMRRMHGWDVLEENIKKAFREREAIERENGILIQHQ